MSDPAIVLAPGKYRTQNGKTAHGLVRGSSRFAVRAIVDATAAGADAGEALDGKKRGIPIVASLADALALPGAKPKWCVVGIATHGGRLTEDLRPMLRDAASRGLSIVNGLHEYAGDDPSIADAARKSGAAIVDVRRPKPKSELHFWTGAIAGVRAPRIAVLGTDCALGKRTTARFLVETANAGGVRAEMIFTGQTGWMQGSPYGIVLDSLPNDFVTGELEHAVVSCDRERAPELIVIEGQSSLRNPAGPCGSELLLSAGARGVVLQHAPGRKYFEGFEEGRFEIPPVAEEIRLIALLGARVLAVTLNGEGLDAAGLVGAQTAMRRELGIPVVRPLEEGLGELLPVVRRFLAEAR